MTFTSSCYGGELEWAWVAGFFCTFNYWVRKRFRRRFPLALVLLSSGCASITPAVPRFVAVYEQQSTFCRIQVIRDTRSPSCFVTFKCQRQPVQALAVPPDVCVP